MAGFNPDRELSKVCTELWELDENRLVPGRDYQIDLQGGEWGETEWGAEYRVELQDRRAVHCEYAQHCEGAGWEESEGESWHRNGHIAPLF